MTKVKNRKGRKCSSEAEAQEFAEKVNTIAPKQKQGGKAGCTRVSKALRMAEAARAIRVPMSEILCSEKRA